MREFYYKMYGYLPDYEDLIDWLIQDGYDEQELRQFSHEQLLESYYLGHEDELIEGPEDLF